MLAKTLGMLGLAVILSAETGAAQGEGSDSDAGLFCKAACSVVNGVDETVQGTFIQPWTQRPIDEAREAVNNGCGNSCQKPRSTNTSSSSAR
jgi:hypothetical protein